MCDQQQHMNTPLLQPQPKPQPPPPPPPTTPPSSEISKKYSPKLVKRMQSESCFRCGQQGHWQYDCPLKSPSPIISGVPKIWCRCGHGNCEVRISNRDENKGRKYYVCPIKRGKRCKDFVKWCDETIDERELHPPPFKYPECECGAGVCGRFKGMKSTGLVKYYFACPVREEHGSCGYKVWEDELLDNKSIVPIQKSSQRTLHDFWKGYQNNTIDNDLGKIDDIIVEHSKRMRIMDNSEDLSLVAVSKLPEGEYAALKEAPLDRKEIDETAAWSAASRHVGFPEFEVADDLEDLDIENSVSWDAIEEEAYQASRLSTPSRICRRQSVFQRHIFAGADADTNADASFEKQYEDSLDPIVGPCPMGWLGRLLFFHPTQSLKFPSLKPFLCCVFPSFNAIVVPKQASVLDGPCGESNQLAVSNSSQHDVQLSNVCHTEVSRDLASPNKSPDSERKLMSKAQRQRQMVLFAQRQLLIDLENFNPLDHASMKEAAEDTFSLLDNLNVDYKQFSDHVWDFLNSTLLLAEIKKSMENFLSPEEYNQHYEREKVRLASIQDSYAKTKALLEVFNQRSKSLHEEASHLTARLHEIQNQLSSCELETLKMESHLVEINRSMLEADAALKVRAEQVETVRKLNEEKQAKENAAKTALEKARLLVITSNESV